MASNRSRLDQRLVELALCESREQAKRLILAGEVSVDGRRVDKPAAPVAPDAAIEVRTRPRFVSRGGLKLEAALDHFGIDPSGRTAVDIGASTGGFTDCLLQRGAERVHTFDVGTNQLAWKIRSDPRVTARENFNARGLSAADVPEPADLVVIDVSFISLTRILPAAFLVLAAAGDLVCLVKPQFEVERGDVGKGGIVRDETARTAALDRIRRFVVDDLNKDWRGDMTSPITGTDGNVEFLAWIKNSPHHDR